MILASLVTSVMTNDMTVSDYGRTHISDDTSDEIILFVVLAWSVKSVGGGVSSGTGADALNENLWFWWGMTSGMTQELTFSDSGEAYTSGMTQELTFSDSGTWRRTVFLLHCCRANYSVHGPTIQPVIQIWEDFEDSTPSNTVSQSLV